MTFEQAKKEAENFPFCEIRAGVYMQTRHNFFTENPHAAAAFADFYITTSDGLGPYPVSDEEDYKKIVGSR